MAVSHGVKLQNTRTTLGSVVGMAKKTVSACVEDNSTNPNQVVEFGASQLNQSES